jgi:hypothetical protein
MFQRRSLKAFVYGLVAAVVIGAILSHQGVFYQTGSQFYRTCWERLHSKPDSKPDTPEQAAAWATCQLVAESAFSKEGFLFSGNPELAVTPQLTAVYHACPSQWSDMFPEDLWRVAVQVIQDNGGPRLPDKFLPAASAVTRAFSTKWPSCVATARKNGFPRIVMRNGSWDFEEKCVPCEAGQEAIAKEQQAWEEREKQTRAAMSAAEKKEADEDPVGQALKERAAEDEAPSACRAPTSAYNERTTRWERQMAKSAARASPECKKALAAEVQGPQPTAGSVN